MGKDIAWELEVVHDDCRTSEPRYKSAMQSVKKLCLKMKAIKSKMRILKKSGKSLSQLWKGEMQGPRSKADASVGSMTQPSWGGGLGLG